MAQRCQAKKGNGEPCGGYATSGGVYCFTHDPKMSVERSVARKKGGMRLRPEHGGDLALIPDSIRTMADVQGLLDYTLKETLVLENSIQRGRLLVAIASTYIEAIEVGDIEQRLERLEEIYSQQNY